MFRSCLMGFFALAFAGFIANAQTPKPGRLEGSVVNSVTGGPVKKATVHLGGPQGVNLSATTDANGHFTFENVQPGSYGMNPSCAGYSQTTTKSIINPLIVAEQQEITNLKLELTPNGVVAGRVLDEDGDPLVHVQVQALQYVYNPGVRHLNGAGFTMTNDLGQFRMINVVPGRYFFCAISLRVGANLPARTVKSFEDLAYAETFYPNTIDIGQSTPQTVSPGAELSGIEFHLKKTAVLHVRGTVVDAQTGHPAPQTSVSIRREGGLTTTTGKLTGPDGTFDFSLQAPGQYAVVAMKNDGEDTKAAHQAVNVGDHDVEGINLGLQQGFRIGGSVTVEGDAPAGKYQIGVNLGTSGQRMGSGGATVKQDGTFEFLNVMPDLYTVDTSAPPEGKYLKSIQFADREINDGIIDLTQQHGGTIHLVFGADPGQIRGTTSARTLITAAPPAGVAIRMDQLRTTISDANGSFQLKNLAPGDYKVMAWEDTAFSMVQSPELRKALEEKAFSVTLAANGNESVQLKPIPAADVDEAIRKLP